LNVATDSPSRTPSAPFQDRFRACLLGGAVGDALGAPVEFMSRSEILRHFGPAGIRDFVPAYGRVGAITDDTQMTLFTAEGLLRAHVRAALKGIGPDFAGVTAHAYLRWLLTQGRRSPLLYDAGGYLLEQRELFSRRAPGNTCLTALEDMQALGEPAVNDSKGCGGVMRVAPAGLYMAHALAQGRASLADAFALGAELAQLTHGHPSGYLAAGAFAALIAALAGGATLAKATDQVLDILSHHSGHQETSDALEQAQALAACRPSDPSAVVELGAGWVAEEALAISVYCALSAADFESGVVLAVNHSGDSDSTGAMTGHLLGLLHGSDIIPRRWLQGLELRRVAETVASDLASYPYWQLSTGSGEADLLWRRYPGC
jgi:ADP-ribosyl-[dinitrogen reductase] hydrolase